MLVAPCYIIVYNAFALTGRTRKPECSTKPRVPLRSALGYGLLPLQGEHVIFIAILSSAPHTKEKRHSCLFSFCYAMMRLRFSEMLHYQHHHLGSQLPAPLLPAHPSEGRLKAMVAPYPIPQLAPSGGTGHTGEIQLRQLTELH